MPVPSIPVICVVAVQSIKITCKSACSFPVSPADVEAFKRGVILAMLMLYDKGSLC